MDSRNIQKFGPIENNGKTPFQVAKEHGHEEICELINSASVKREIENLSINCLITTKFLCRVYQ